MAWPAVLAGASGAIVAGVPALWSCVAKLVVGAVVGVAVAGGDGGGGRVHEALELRHASHCDIEAHLQLLSAPAAASL